MLTEEQKRGLEGLYDSYSLHKVYDSKFEEKYDDKMMALRIAVIILGYRFMFNHMEEEYGVEYPAYRLEEIENWVAFIDKNQRGRASYS